MKIILRDNAEKYSLPLPILKSVHIADAICREGKEYDVLAGLDKGYIEQLKELSADENDTALRDFTSDRKRFVVGTYEYWYQKNRSIFALINKQNDELAAIVWFGPKPLGKKSPKFSEQLEPKVESERDLSSDWHTISVRSYPKYRGKGIMKVFTKFAMDTYKQHFPHVKFWSGMDDRNPSSVGLHKDLGFVIDEQCSDLSEHWLIMTTR